MESAYHKHSEIRRTTASPVELFPPKGIGINLCYSVNKTKYFMKFCTIILQQLFPQYLVSNIQTVR